MKVKVVSAAKKEYRNAELELEIVEATTNKYGQTCHQSAAFTFAGKKKIALVFTAPVNDFYDGSSSCCIWNVKENGEINYAGSPIRLYEVIVK